MQPLFLLESEHRSDTWVLTNYFGCNSFPMTITLKIFSFRTFVTLIKTVNLALTETLPVVHLCRGFLGLHCMAQLVN